MKKLLLIVGVLAALLLASVSSVSAFNDWKSSGKVYVGANPSGFCQFSRAKIGNGPDGGGALDGTGWSRKIGPPWSTCGLGFSNTYPESVAPGNLIVNSDVFKLNNGSWVLCASTGWKHNTVWTASVHFYAYQGGWTPPCGSGIYEVVTTSYTWHNGWKGGGAYSPTAFLPSADQAGLDANCDFQSYCPPSNQATATPEATPTPGDYPTATPGPTPTDFPLVKSR